MRAIRDWELNHECVQIKQLNWNWLPWPRINYFYLSNDVANDGILVFFHFIQFFDCDFSPFTRHRNSVHDPSKTCITFDAINTAYLDARKRIREYFWRLHWTWIMNNLELIRNRVISTDVSQPKGEWLTEDIATVGELLLDISIQLART